MALTPEQMAQLPDATMQTQESLTPEQMAALPDAPKEVGLTESFLRGAAESATFGFDDKLGLSKEAREASRKANPWTHFMGEMAGAVAPMVGAAPLAAVRGAGLLARGARAVGSALAPTTKIDNIGQAVLQGTKLGATYGGLSGAGHADVKDEDSLAASLGKRALGAGLGAGAGAVLGAPLGAAAHGASRAVGAVLNRALPELQDLRAAASQPELQGIRDVVREAGYDKYTMADFAALQERLRDPAQRHLYEGLNLIEALETRPLQALPTGELKPSVAVSPNLSSLAQDYANTGGAGRQEAVEAFATRKNEMASKVQQDVERLFTDPTVTALQNTFGQQGRRAGEVEALPAVIDAVFGSGQAEANATALAATKKALGTRYDRLRSAPLQQIDELGQVAQNIPEFNAALQTAAKNDFIRMVSEGVEGAQWAKPWSAGDLGKTIQTLSPDNILDIHHHLVMSAKPPLTGATPESMMAGKLKNWFSQWVDAQFKGHKALRDDYAVFKRTVEAQEQAAKVGSVRGGDDAMKFFRDITADYNKAAQGVAKKIESYDRSMGRFQAGEIKRMPPKLDAAEEALAAKRGVIEAFRRTFGENLKRELAEAPTPAAQEALLKKWLSQAGQERIMQIAGPDAGPGFINHMMVMEARNQGRALGLKAGGDDAASIRFFDKAVREGNTDVQDAFREAWGQRIRNELAATNEGTVGTVIKALTTQEGKDRILKILGPDVGREFIETLYNKVQQMGLSQRLWGGPDTAYKMARQKRMSAWADATQELAKLPLAPFGMFSPSRLWTAARDVASANYQQRRADLGNQLLAKQGPEEVDKVIAAILARNQLIRTGQPYSLKPALYATGPAAAAIPAQRSDLPSDRLPGKQRP